MAVVANPGEPTDLIRSVARALRVLESVGQSQRGLTTKQIARRCELTTATAYHIVRTLTYEGYLSRRNDGSYSLGLEVADRFRELAAILRGPASVTEALRYAALSTGYSHFLGTFLNDQIVISQVAEGSESPYLEDLVPGFDDGAHATALGKALLATMSVDQRQRYLKSAGLRPYTDQTIVDLGQLEDDLKRGEAAQLHVQIDQFKQGLACAAVVVVNDEEPHRRFVLACAMPAQRLDDSVTKVREELADTARSVRAAIKAQQQGQDGRD